MKRILFIALALAMVLTLVVPVMAQDYTVTTSAYVDTGGSPPEVLAAWQWAAGYQAGTQVTPNTQGSIPTQGAETQICVWAVVTDPNGIGDIKDVFFRVFHPDGSQKHQVHMQPVWGTENWVAAKALALNSGQMTSEQARVLDEMLEKNTALMYYACWPYHTHQPAGPYRTQVTAVDQSGNVGHMDAWLTISSIVVLAIDFDRVEFGPIVPGAAKWVAGNKIFNPGDGRPTVWNQGNINAGIRVHNTAMVGREFGKEIIDFDVKLLGQTELYQASTWVNLWGPLRPCTPEQIDFSIHPPYGIPGDSYYGTIHLSIFGVDNG